MDELFCDGSACSCDWLEIEGEKYCGEIQTPFTVITNTNNVDIKFISDDIQAANVARSGFMAIWSFTTEAPTPRTTFVSCGQHFAIDCSQCPYDGDTLVGEGWCNGDCCWKDQECLPITKRTYPEDVINSENNK